MKVLFRVDASPEIGFGHAMRCLALANAVQDAGGRSVFLMSQGGPQMSGRFARQNIVWSLLVTEGCTSADARETVAASRRSGSDWVVADGYGFDAAYQRILVDEGVRLMILDDGGRIGSYHSNLILDQNESSPKTPYITANGRPARLLIGARYSLVREEFQSDAKPVSREVRNVMVTMGGGSDHGIAANIVRAFSGAGQEDVRLTVVTGIQNPQSRVLQSLQSERIDVLAQVEDMPELMKKADLAITAAGSICWEYCAMGVPMLIFVTDDNQESVARPLVEAGAAVRLGPWCIGRSARDLVDAMRQLRLDAAGRQAMAEKGRRMIDGQGARRVVGVLQAMTDED